MSVCCGETACNPSPINLINLTVNWFEVASDQKLQYSILSSRLTVYGRKFRVGDGLLDAMIGGRVVVSNTVTKAKSL